MSHISDRTICKQLALLTFFFLSINLLLIKTVTAQQIVERPVFSHEAGFYDSGFDLSISHPQDNVRIYYTLDGSTPTENSTLFTEPLAIADRSHLPNNLSTIPTNYIDGRFQFNPPSGLIPKATVLRVLVTRDGYDPAYWMQTYFVFPEGADKHSFPVISIASDEDNFFGARNGIYVPGNNYREGRDNTGNFYQRGRNWERESTFEFFEENGERVIAQNAGVRIHGGTSRRYSHKSLRIYARSDYGENRLNHEIYPDLPYDSYKRLILRPSSQDQGHTMFKDAFAQHLVKHLNFDTQASRPSIVYINGEYWGIHNIRERFDHRYLERVYGVDRDEIDHLEDQHDVREGNNRHYREMIDFVESNDLSSDSNMETVKTMIDTESYLDYFSSQIYYVNFDWPHKNIQFWRYQTDYSPNTPVGLDGRWRWMMFDLDEAFRNERSNLNGRNSMIDYLTRSRGAGSRDWPNTLLRNLLENEQFKYDFINRMADLLNTAFHPDHVVSELNRFTEIYEPEMREYINRWNRPRNMSQWRTEIGGIQRVAERRPRYLLREIQEHFDIPSTAEFTIDSNFGVRSPVQVNSILISPDTPGISDSPYPWTGTYLSGIPVTLKAPNYPAAVFSHWEVNGNPIYNPTIQVLPDTASSVRAIFEESNIRHITPFQLADNNYYFNAWDEDQQPGTYPESMAFVYMDSPDPGIDAAVAGLTLGAYNLNSRTRINGLEDDGISFINTGNEEGNPGYPGTRLGGALLILDTRDTRNASVSFNAATLAPGSRIYHLRLQYRVGSDGEFTDITDANGDPVEYRRRTEEHSKSFEPISLPDQIMDQERVELLWRYYYTGNRIDSDSGQRTEIGLSSIHVERVPEYPSPQPHNLSDASYRFSHWPADTTTGAAPDHMRFVYMNEEDPGLNADILGFTSGAFNHINRTRINGLGNRGFSFINTGNRTGNPGYPGRRLGGAVLALNTIGQGSVSVEWRGYTVQPNSRVYNIRLQYRTSPDDPFRDVVDSQGNPVEYERNREERHSEVVGPVILPPDADNKPHVELFWRYYYTGEQLDEQSGQRSEMGVRWINVHSVPLMGGEGGELTESKLFQNFPNPFYPVTNIRFDLMEAQHVQIHLYSVTGQHVALLADDHFEAGRHSISANVPQLSSGIYIYRLVSDGFTATGKMSVIK